MFPKGARSVKVIITADDFGRSRTVNQTIMELIAQRRVTSSSIIANSPYFEQAASFAKDIRDCSFGVHLNLTQFQPLSGPGGLHSILDENGIMQRKPNRTFANPSLLRACYIELCSQVERCVRFGIRIACLDSHHHIHTNPIILPMVKMIQKKYGINGLRLTKNIYNEPQPSSKKLVFKALYNSSLRLGCKTKLTQGFTEFLTFYDLAQKKQLPYSSIELMAHPGAESEIEELAILKSSWETRICFPVKLISYNQL